MQAVREIRNITTQDLVITLPPEFVRKEVEIIVLCVESNTTGSLTQKKNADWERELETLSWNMGSRFYRTREELYDRHMFS